MAKQSTLSEQLRQAIDASGKTRYRIWKESGVSQARLSLFMAGKAGLSIPAIDKLGQLLGLRLVADGEPIAKAERTPKKAADAKGSKKTTARKVGKRKGG
jgi:hypothetical protein